MDSDVSKDAEQVDRKLTTFSVSFYVTTGLVMILTNKWVLNVISVPITYLWAQTVLVVCLLHVSGAFNLFVIPKLKFRTCISLMPLIVINVVGLAFNTLCLQYLDVSFYQVVRSLALPFTLILSWIVLKNRCSASVNTACAVVCGGFLIGVLGELNSLNTCITGIIFGVISSVTTATHAILIKKSLEVVNNNTMELVYYNTLLSAVVLVPVILLNSEIPGLFSLFGSQENRAQVSTFIVGVLITGFFGFLSNIAGFLQIKVTTPVAHITVSTVRGILQTILAVYFFEEILTTSRICGIGIILAGSAYYTHIKDLESKQKEFMKSKDAAEKV
ncbi:hypothetical protein K493DRAFT_265247 [Basidiobolus meristosporus CBS 931.73]|uniref:Sugar phosphate transporter domain-containing protein n=1 Tax=Basidiobolus meristosporus CBS 931.73 TaxID=1314790 RepID=A0A1Y1XZS9_9FUNG|nr:hypothetical protein K493DRAFT_265247 [Basidiobolus meristosporus CBS 931.73]|eukprot:ORX90874.1 hypothetical protein K493DRAFT_265247 [Basidiobolus meristosporus CBS 931.73]